MISGPARFRFHRSVDVVVSVLGIIASSPLIAFAWVAASRSAKGSGLFRQTRIGRNAQPFEIVKFRTMRAQSEGSTVTAANDDRITSVGRLLRRTKLDEVPQLVNVLRGEMSLVGPRPDVPGFADDLRGEDRVILQVRPGVTGPASILLANEERLLTEVADPVAFNADTLYPMKTAINRAWIERGSLIDDLKILAWTIKRPPNRQIQSLITSWNPALDLEPLEQKLGK